MSCPSCRAENDPSAAECFACGSPLHPALSSLAEGAIFASRFRILGPLGRGGMGMVYRAFDRDLGETVAIKVLRPDVARQSGRGERRFRSEIRLARRVRHRNVCSVYGDGEDRGLRYICMELVEGENLAVAARRDGGLPPAEAWDAALQVSDGLVAIHDVGVVHRDLKTANLMRDHRGVVRVMDFGIAKLCRGASGSATVTATGSLMGTPEYMSPEQLRGDEVDFRSDLYSLGVVTYELFTGTLPFRGETAVATIVKQLQDAPRLEAPALPDALRPLLRVALAKAPAERFVDAREMRRALGAARKEATEGRPRPASRGASASEGGEAQSLAANARRRVPLVRIALTNLALAALASHLLGAGGARAVGTQPASPPSLAEVAAPVDAGEAATARSSARPHRAPEPLPSPSTLPTGQTLAILATPVPARAAPASPLPVFASPVYGEDEVDLKPRRISGMSASYPEWGPRLSRGERVSITASFVVTETGDVTDIRVEKGGGVLEAVLLEISRWKYEPGMKDGVPVKVRVRFRHTFIGG
jgi:hypothetical protein